MEPGDAERLQRLEQANDRLKRLGAGAVMDASMLGEMPGQSPDAGFEKPGRVPGDDRETLFASARRRAGRARAEGLPIRRGLRR